MISSSLQSLTSYTNNLLAGQKDTTVVGGVRINMQEGTVVEEGGWKDDAISLSPEAQAVLERIDNLTSKLSLLQAQLGGRELSESEIAQISEITAQLDDIYDIETVPPSESFLYMTEANREVGTRLISEISNIYESIPDGALPTDAQQADLDRLTGELDALLDQSRVRASHNIADLPADIGEEVIAQFAALTELLASSETLTATQAETAAAIAQNIDNAFTEFGVEKPARELSEAEQSKADKLMEEIAELFEQAESTSLSSFLLESRAQSTSLFLSILNGNDAGSEDPFEALLMGIQNSNTSNINARL
ncbi:MAG: hypothetical protein OSB62_08065 [Alphaproteobacteria bacterium]|nr:hypothetical protein [Alphaproteobacteria bacterium]